MEGSVLILMKVRQAVFFLLRRFSAEGLMKMRIIVGGYAEGLAPLNARQCFVLLISLVYLFILHPS